LTFVGKVSYGIFVFHTLAAFFVSPWLKAVGLEETSYLFLRAAILTAISIAVAAVSWRWMDQPLNRWVRDQEFDFSRFWEHGKAAMSNLLSRISGPTNSV
jgi:peptidoglycan/LPS O-acetylase OafA/YrhL